MKPLESTIVADIRAVFARLPFVCLWHNKERHVEAPDGRMLYLPGLECPGSSDLIGILQIPSTASDSDRRPYGVFLAIEVKRPGGKPTPDQAVFMSRVRSFGGIAGWATSAESACELVLEARGNRDRDLQLVADAVAAVLSKRKRKRAPVRLEG